MEKIAVYPGSFDPITNGHLDIIKRAARIFDKLYVSILVNSSKQPAFSLEERLEMIKKVTSQYDNVVVDSFSGLLVNYLKDREADVIVRGLRAVSDFEYEFQMALMNHKLEKNIETLFMMTSGKYSYLSSSIVKEIGHHGGNLKDLVPDILIDEISDKLKLD
ncbi:MAG: pantetheine-phosphate adenylyltransferase [Clostridia bacterium]|nr:pantetheine-phosphate adenylyltransferase [Clostridia bacterium]